jgi:hypothetical protein
LIDINYDEFVEQMVPNIDFCEDYLKNGLKALLSFIEKEMKKIPYYKRPVQSMLDEENYWIMKLKNNNVWRTARFKTDDENELAEEIAIKIIDKFNSCIYVNNEPIFPIIKRKDINC